jgi:hypothetical protein
MAAVADKSWQREFDEVPGAVLEFLETIGRR